MRWLCLSLVAVAGCATSGSTVAPRPAGPQASAQRYTGDPYDVWDHGSRISGDVCGLNVEYTVKQDNGTTRLDGFGGSSRPMFLEVSSQAGGRRITGSLGTRVGTNEVDLFVSDGALKGRAGIRSFDLAARGDELTGRMTALDTLQPVEATVLGRGELGKLPDAALGAILPSLLNCGAPFGRRVAMRPDVVVRIGGPAGYESRYSNEIGRSN